MQQQALKIRAKKLGVLMVDARLASRRTLDECARSINVSVERLQQYEAGEASPSLPEIEAYAYFLEIPLDHFWNNQSLAESTQHDRRIELSRLAPLRQKMIGALLRQARTQANQSIKDVAQKTGFDEALITQYELGERPIPLPDLDTIATSLDVRIEQLFDQKGPVGAWRAEQQAVQQFLELPPELQEFLCKPINRPYINLALHLSELSAEKLRMIAESLLEITY